MSAPANKTRQETEQSPGQIVLGALKHAFTHDVGIKIFALIISVILWAGLISQDESVTREKTFSDVTISVTGADTMRRNGYIVVSNMDEMLSAASVTAAVPQKQYEKAEASAYNLRVDLSRINGTGKQELRILNTPSTLYGRVVSTSPASVMVDVEDYVIRQRIPVSVNMGKIPEDWYVSTPTVDPTMLTVSGPKSVVETIMRARAYLDPDSIEWEEGVMLTSVPFELYNRSGEVVSNPLMQITSGSTLIDSVLVEATILPVKTFDVTGLIETGNAVAKGYEIKDIRISPETVRIAASQDVLDQLTEVPLDSRVINVRNLRETTVFQLKVQKPSEDAVLINDTVTVTVEIGAKES